MTDSVDIRKNGYLVTSVSNGTTWVYNGPGKFILPQCLDGIMYFNDNCFQYIVDTVHSFSFRINNHQQLTINPDYKSYHNPYGILGHEVYPIPFILQPDILIEDFDSLAIEFRNSCDDVIPITYSVNNNEIRIDLAISLDQTTENDYEILFYDIWTFSNNHLIGQHRDYLQLLQGKQKGEIGHLLRRANNREDSIQILRNRRLIFNAEELELIANKR